MALLMLSSASRSKRVSESRRRDRYSFILGLRTGVGGVVGACLQVRELIGGEKALHGALENVDGDLPGPIALDGNGLSSRGRGEDGEDGEGAHSSAANGTISGVVVVMDVVVVVTVAAI